MGLVAGKSGEEITDLLKSDKYVNEFLITKKLGITINQTRNILYKLSDCGLVSSIRKKDRKKGWYTYFWRIEILKSLEFLRGNLSKSIEQLKHQLRNRETKRFYACERCNVEYNEETALLHNFTCEECGGIFTMRGNVKLLKDMRKELERLEKQKDLIDKEIQEEKEKLGRKKQRELKKEEKKIPKKSKIKKKKEKTRGKAGKKKKKSLKIRKHIKKKKMKKSESSRKSRKKGRKKR